MAWLSNVRKIPSISTDYIYFADLTNRFDEGSESIQLEADVGLSDMQKYIREHSIDDILLNGKYDEHPVVIGVDPYENIENQG